MIAFLISMNVVNLTFTGMEVAVGVLIFTLALLVFAIAYKKTVAYFGKKAKPTQKYCVLYRIETQPAEGTVQFYFTAEAQKEVALFILNENYQIQQEIYRRKCRKDGNIIEFDTRSLPNGIYFYCLQTDNQKTMKKLVVNNKIL